MSVVRRRIEVPGRAGRESWRRLGIGVAPTAHTGSRSNPKKGLNAQGLGLVRRCFDAGGPRTCRLCCGTDQLEGGLESLGGPHSDLHFSAMHAIDALHRVFCRGGGFLAGGCSTSRKLLHLSSPLFVWLKIGFCSFFQLIPPSPFERDFQRVPTPHLALPIAVSPPLSRRGHRPCYRAQTLDRSYQFRHSKRHSLPKQSRKWGLQFPEDQ